MTATITSFTRCMIITFLFFFISSLISGCWGIPSSDSSNKCVPPDRSGMEQVRRRSGYIYTYKIPDDIESVQAEFLTGLQPAPWQGPFGGKLWRLKEFDGSFLYECVFGKDGYEIEVGCVFIREEQDKTIIQLVWEIGEGGGSCASILGIPK